MTSARRAAMAVLAVSALQLVGYYVAAELRGYSSGGAIVVFWSACAIVGGPLFGAAGRLWHSSTDRLRGLGAATLAAAFLAEGTPGRVVDYRYVSESRLTSLASAPCPASR